MKIPADFDAEIWSVVAEIPAGRVATYGQLARLIGMPGHARRAGRALALAPEGLPPPGRQQPGPDSARMDRTAGVARSRRRPFPGQRLRGPFGFGLGGDRIVRRQYPGPAGRFAKKDYGMKRYALLLYILFLAAAVRAATPRPQPLYIVNGKETSEIRSIPPEDIENVEMLPADEETIARYGQRAAHGVMLITLRYDRPASFPADSAFGSYIARQVRWDESEPTARVVLRYKITPDGETVVQQELESTDNRLKRRVLKAVAEAPRWHPAQKNGAPVESEGVLSIQLPEGRRMPRQAELVIR